MIYKQSILALALSAVALVLLVFLGVRHYGGNVSALLHMDVPFGELHSVPEGIVLYQDAAYDGMLYYQVARDLPALFMGGETSLDSPYRFQRILLPLIIYMVAIGNEQAFPYAMLIINIAAALGALALMLSIAKKISIHAFTIVFNPAILVGILYSLTEPLSIFFMMGFFWLWMSKHGKVTVMSIALLLLSLLARETTIFLIGLLFLWFLWKKEWKNALLVLLPIALFALWQWYLVIRLGSIPFRTGGGIIVFPLQGPIAVLQWSLQESGIKLLYRLSGVSLLGFAALLSIALGREWIQKKTRIEMLPFLLSGLCLTMLSMDPHMWGAITSIGRVVTPLYPVYALWAAERDTWIEKCISVILMAVSVVAAIGIASVAHPYVLS